MKIRPLIIDRDAKTDIARLIAYAEAHPQSIHNVFKAVGNPERAAGNLDPGYICVVKVGYRCVYTIEQQSRGLCRHLSVSVLGDGCAPNEAAVLVLMQEFGFRGGFKDVLSMYTEEIGDNKIAINVIQLRDEQDKRSPGGAGPPTPGGPGAPPSHDDG